MKGARSELITFDRKLLEEREYWINRLSHDIETTNLRLDFLRPVNYTTQKDAIEITLAVDLFQKLEKLTSGGPFLLYTTLMSALIICLYRYTGSATIYVGCPPVKEKSDLRQPPNALTIFQNIDDRVSFRELLIGLRQTLLDAHTRQDYPFDRLVRDLRLGDVSNKCPLFDVALILSNIHAEMADVGNDITFAFTRADDHIGGVVSFNSNLFRRETIERFANHFANLLSAALNDPSAAIFELQILNETELRHLLEECNDTRTDFKSENCINELFERQAELRKDSLAVVFDDEMLSYGELNRRANQLAHYLRRKGVGPETLVGLYIERGIEMLVGLLGIIKAGGAYVPLDPNYPAQRLAFMLEDADLGVLVTQNCLLSSLPGYNGEAVSIDSDWDQIAQECDKNPTSGVSARNLVYVIYTSGSTGNPKGVLVEHKGLCNLSEAQVIAFGVSPDSCVLQFASLNFDASIFEIVMALRVGARLCLCRKELMLPGRPLMNLLRSQGVTNITVPPSVLAALPAEELPALQTIVVAGEACMPDLVSRWGSRHRFFNAYGPTETTVWATVARCEGTDEIPPIGRPIANVKVYTLDTHLQPVPVGVAGELHIGGDGLARGYLNRPELTSERFIVSPFSDEPGARLYKTGDLVRYLPDGNIEFAGRIDNQVKVRGFRIELGEIEASLGQHPGVLDAVVIASGDDLAGKQLVAYVVADHKKRPSLNELHKFLKGNLPDYMVPAVFVFLEALPLTPNGKVDRRALPSPEQDSADRKGTFVAPCTPEEDVLAGIWAEILGYEQVSVDDNFFHLGGHSLLATRAITRLCEVFKIDLPLQTLFEHPTVEELAEKIEEIRRKSEGIFTPPIEPVPRDRPLRLSFAQQRLWFLDQYEPDSPFYNISAAIQLSGELNTIALQECLNQIVARHEALRTIFVSHQGEPRQIITQPVATPLMLIDLSELEEEQREEEARRVARQEAQAPFDLRRGPVFRAKLLRLGRDEHVLTVTMHHIVSDGWSLGVMVKELGETYGAKVRGGAREAEEMRIQYGDYAEWQREWMKGEVLERQIRYWKGRLEGGARVLEMPTDRPRPAIQSYKGRSLTGMMERELTGRLKGVSKREGVTLYMTLLAGMQTLLFRYSGQGDISIGTAIANRNRKEIEGVIGLFANTLVMRGEVRGEERFTDRLREVREETLGGYGHQELPFEQLVEVMQPERALSHSPLFQVMFGLQTDLIPELELLGLTIGLWRSVSRTSKFDLSLMVTETDSRLQCGIEYNIDLFDESTISRILWNFKNLLEGIVDNPEGRISDIPILSAAELQQILVEWNDTRANYQTGFCLHTLFERQVELNPLAIALSFEGQELTYRDLNGRANRVANYLRSLGAGPEARVGICIERSIEMIVGLLGTLKAGAAYVPLDPAYPKHRLAFMLEDAQARVLLTQERLLGVLGEHDTYQVCLDSDWTTISKHSDQNPYSQTLERNLSYLIYTSGSTGRPKAVAIEHHSAVIMVQWAAEVFDDEELSGVLASTSICFDLSVFELFVPLSRGGKVILAENALQLPVLAAREEVKLINTVPSAIAELVRIDGLPSSLKTVNLAGEPLQSRLVAQVYEGRLIERVLNLYGPSEDTTYSTYLQIPRGWKGAVGIGKPVANTQAYILDKRGNPVPIGVKGELCLAGEGLARGYLYRPKLTAEKFVPNPFSQEPGKRMYKTGDLARFLPDGNIEFLGRTDHQVKIRGYRIELDEIQAALADHPDLRDAAVQVREDPQGDKRLVAFIVAAQEEKLDLKKLRTELRERLPEYMVPGLFVMLEELPMTANGKLNRQALSDMDLSGEEAAGGKEAESTPIEEVLQAIWSHVLGREVTGKHDNFFDLGGHSLLATQVMSRVTDALGTDLAVRELFEHPTVEELAEKIEEIRRKSEGIFTPPIEPVPRDRPLRLSFAQQRLWFLDQYEPDSPFYNISAAIQLSGELNTIALQECLNQIVARHEALRTIFVSHQGEPRQIITQPVATPLMLIDLSELEEEQREEEARRVARQEAQAPFDLRRGPVFRAKLLRLGRDEHVLTVTMHHIVSDGWSLGVMVKELGETYGAKVRGGAREAEEMRIQYGDYAEWQREWMKGEVLERQIRYWKGRLEGGARVLEMPTDRPRPAIQSYKGRSLTGMMERELTGRLKGVSKREGVTLYMTLLAGMQTLLFRYSGQGDISIGTAIANRNRKEIEGVIGLFANTLVMRGEVRGEERYIERLREVREETLEGYRHQELPFEQLVEVMQPERALSHSPLFQVMFILQNAPMKGLIMEGLELTPLNVETETARLDLTFSLTETAQGLMERVEYNTDLFDQVTITRLLGHFQNLLQAIASDPQQRLWELPLLSETERTQMLIEWNDPSADYHPVCCIHQLLEAQAERAPNKIALVCDDERLTFRELNRRANKLAHYLQSTGVGPEARVGIFLDRGTQMIIGLLAILKAGGAYVPMDPAYPKDRLAFMLEDGRVQAVLTQAHLLENIPDNQANVFCIDRDWDLLADRSDLNPTSGVEAENLAYVIYTSGSTGRPKGVQVSHRSVVHMIEVISPHFEFDLDDVWTVFHSYAFDLSVWEIWGALLQGARLVIVPAWMARSPEAFDDLLMDEGVTILSQTPSAIRQLIHSREERTAPERSRVRLIACGGEAFPREVATQLQEWGVPVWNFYGPTEATVWVAVDRVEANAMQEIIPIGRPIRHTQFYVLDQRMQPVPIGVTGELHIGGIGLARGYFDRPGMTAERFAPNPFSREPGERLYKSGDLARYLPDGKIEFIGRVDEQVKLRGYRIELGEIESVMIQHDLVDEAVVVIKELGNGDVRLAAYMVLNEAVQDLKQVFRSYLEEKLPEYMVPVEYVTLESMPLTANRKVDRQALKMMELQTDNETSLRPEARTPVEEMLAGVWSGVLGIERVGINENFFSLGGHSLLATKIISLVRDVFEVEMPVRALFEAPTIEAFSRRIEEKRREGFGLQSPPLERVSRDSELLLSFSQQRLWFLNQYEPDSPFYNISVAVRLTGDLQVDALEESLNEVIRRHEGFRTIFINLEGEPRQQIQPAKMETLPRVDLSELEIEKREEEARLLASREAGRVFDLAVGPLLRTRLIRLDNREHILVLATHHIVADRAAIGILVEELAALYGAIIAGKPSPLSDLSFQYADFAQWQRRWISGEVLQKQLDYWKRQLADAPPVLDLPTDGPRPPVQTFNGARRYRTLPDPLSDALRALSRREGVTLYMTLLAVFKSLLYHYSGQEDIVVGAGIANRNRVELERLIGLFINTVVLRTKLSGNPTFRDLLARVREVALDSNDNQDVPFEMLVEELQPVRLPSYPPLFQVAFVFYNAPTEAIELPGLRLSALDLGNETAKWDLTLFVNEAEKGLAISLEYNTDLFDASTIEKMLEHYVYILSSVTADPDQPIKMLPLWKQEIADLLSIPPSRIERMSPLTPTQRDLYLAQAIAPESTNYAIGFTLNLGRMLDRDLWGTSIATVIESDDISRTRFVSIRDRTFQFVDKERRASFEFLDFVDAGPHSYRLERLINEYVFRKYDLCDENLVQNLLIREPDGNHVALLTNHHLIFDGLSAKSFLERVLAIYESLLKGLEPELKDRASFYDYVGACLSHFDTKEVDRFWREKLESVAPLEFHRGPNRSKKEVAKTITVTGEKLREIKEYCEATGCSLALLLRTLYGLLISSYFDSSDDFVVYEIIGGRPQEHLSTLGCFYQVLPIVYPRELFEGDLSIVETLGYLRKYKKNLGPMQDISVFLQKQILLQNGVRFFYNLYTFTEMEVFGRPAMLRAHVPFPEEEVHLILYEFDGALELSIHYNESHFSDHDFLDRLVSLSSQIARGGRLLSEMDLLLDCERDKLLLDWKGPKFQYECDRCLHQLFEEQVEMAGDRVAVAFEDSRLTYRELDERANQLAHYLKKRGVGSNVLVGISVERSLEMVVAILSVLKAGGAYLPLDTSYPPDRISFMLEDSQVPIVLTQQSQIESLRQSRASLVCLDADWNEISRESVLRPFNSASPQSLAYVIYTSGSTGRPKGVMVDHSNVARLFESTREWFDFDERDVWTLFHSFAFDFSVWEIWGALLYGGRLEVVPYWVSREPEMFYDLLCREGVTVLNQTPSAFRQLITAEELSGERTEELALRYVVFGGEALELQSLKPWFDRHGDRSPQLINMYGITETTVHVTYRSIKSVDLLLGAGSVIGGPIPDLEILILDRCQRPVPIGIPGELYIGGAGVARGYLRRPELTSIKFVPNPFSGIEGDRLYRSGDLARYLPDGDIEYLGRIDQQVKIRGFRIEPGEIESVLVQHSGIRDAAVLAHEDPSGENRLIAYVVADTVIAPSVGDLRSFLGEQLPDYMVPSAILMLEALPLTSNGKLDRRALESLDTSRPDSSDELVAPRTDVEESLAEIWAQVLNLEEVSVHDSFFELGGHSLLATQVMSRIREAFKLELPLRYLFERPTIAGLATSIEELREAEANPLTPPMQPVSRERPLPLSFAQQRLWFLNQLEHGNSVYNTPIAVRLSGRLNVAALQESLSEIKRRHEVLRTTFEVIDNHPVQVIAGPRPLALPIIDLCALPREAREATAKRLATEEARRPFDLARGPVLRTTLLSLAQQDYILLLTMHHIVSDNWSMGVLTRELTVLYEAFLEGKPSPLPELPIQYADFAVWQREWMKGDNLTSQLAYWKQHLSGMPASLDLPTDRARTQAPTFNGATQYLLLPESLSAELRALSNQEGVTLFMTLLAAYTTLLFRYSGQDDVCVGSGVANRTRTELEGLIGFTLNTLVLRTDLSGNPTFRELLGRVREVTLGAFAHQELPFEKIVEEIQPDRSANHQPLFQVTFYLQNAPMSPVELPGLTLSPVAVDTGAAHFDLTLFMRDTEQGLIASLEYNTDLFNSSTISRMLDHLRVVLEEVVFDADRRLIDIPLMAEEPKGLSGDITGFQSRDEAEEFDFQM